jgi:RND family efflux transporter MFP subunit
VRTSIIGFLAALPLSALALGCGKTSEAAPKAEVASPASSATRKTASTAVRVDVATLTESEAALDVTVPGEVKGSRDADLASPGGGLVEKVLVEEGATVRSGQVLALVDASLRGVQLEQVRTELEQARKDAERAKALADLVSEADRERSSTGVKLLESKLRMARLEVGRATIKAPFAGIVARVDVEEGEVVMPGAPVVRVVKLDPVEVDLSVPDRDVVAMRIGESVTIDAGAHPGVAQGKIVRISPAGNLETRAFTVGVEASNPEGKLLPGMIANVRVRRALPKGAVVIPQEWLVTRLEEIGVFLEAGGVSKWRSVKAKEVIRDQVVIEDGLAMGDRIVMVGHRDLADGDPLHVNRDGRCCANGRAVFSSAE